MDTEDQVDAIVIPKRGLRQGIRSGAARPDDQDADGLSLELLYPGYFGMFSLPNVDLLVACQKNYNDWVFDYASDANGRLAGLAAIPLQDPDAGLTELRRVIDKGFKGVCIPCTSPAEKPYFEACYDPIWALAQEAGMPVSMHVGCNAMCPAVCVRQRRTPWPPMPDRRRPFSAPWWNCSAAAWRTGFPT